MDKNSKKSEPTINYWKRFDQNENIDIKDLEDNIAYTVCVMAKSVS